MQLAIGSPLCPRLFAAALRKAYGQVQQVTWAGPSERAGKGEWGNEGRVHSLEGRARRKGPSTGLAQRSCNQAPGRPGFPGLTRSG